MKLLLENSDIQGLIPAGEILFETPAGEIRIHTVEYSEQKLQFLLDHPLGNNMKCLIDKCDIQDNLITANCNIPDNFLVRNLLKLITNTLSLSKNGIAIKYPQLIIDQSIFNIPFQARSIEFLPETLQIIATVK
jgi:hypothetical protein